MMQELAINADDLTFFIVILTIALISLIMTRKLLKIPFSFFFMGVLGAVIGLAVGFLLGRFLAGLPGLYGRWLPIVVQVFVAVAIFDLFIAQAEPAAKFLGSFFRSDGRERARQLLDIVVDTSVLIDGRIEQVVQAGFVFGRLIVPRFVLTELQSIADAAEPLKRTRGRRGLEILSNLQQNRQIIIEINEELARDRDGVDSKLVRLAKKEGAKVMTVDYNLGQVAQIQGVEVLNLNELAAALKPQLVPGENLQVKVIQKGKEKKQGVGYLDDGTMVVIEGGDRYVGEEINCEVVRIYQTVAGKMIFVQPKKTKE